MEITYVNHKGWIYLSVGHPEENRGGPRVCPGLELHQGEHWLGAPHVTQPQPQAAGHAVRVGGSSG